MRSTLSLSLGRSIVLVSLVTLLFSSTRAFNDDDDDDDGDDLEELTLQLNDFPEYQNTTKQTQASLLWGTYRPQIYFGLRPRLPESFLTGLAWFGINEYTGFQNMRHQCSDQDKMKGFGWKYHDGREFGIQEINDIENNYRIETSFFKVDTFNPTGGSWGARISATVINQQIPSTLTTFWYTAIESEQAILSLENHLEENGLDSSEPVHLSGSVPGLGDFTMRIQEPTPQEGNSNKDGNVFTIPAKHDAQFAQTAGKTHWIAKSVPHKDVWKAKDILLENIGIGLQQTAQEFGAESMPAPWLSIRLSNQMDSQPTFVAVQKTFSGNFTFDVFFDSASTPKEQQLISTALTMALRASQQAYDDRFEQSLGLLARGYTPDQFGFARDLTSSLVGGIAYMHGSAIVDRSFAHEYDVAIGSGEYDTEASRTAEPRLTEPQELLTATPSRSIFPRGFYWDEGFHLAHIGIWDNDLSLEILASWIRLIDEQGWVAREQILGDEARSRVPEAFQTQYPLYANPPTLILAVTSYIDRLMAQNDGGQLPNVDAGPFQQFGRPIAATLATDGWDENVPIHQRFLASPSLGQAFLKQIYPKLQRHYRWFRRTQRGEIKQWDRQVTARGEAFRWRGRTQHHVLTSGLDDYPRASVAHTGELHLDLMSWMGSFANTMTKIANALDLQQDVEEYQTHYQGIVSNLNDLHWNSSANMYCDVSVDSQDQSFHVCHIGYVSLFPLLLDLVSSNDPHLESILNLIHDPQHLWSPYGIRSLSLQDPFYGQGENYWRGPIWIQINYLVLKALKNKYTVEQGPFQNLAIRIYQELRSNLIENVFNQYQTTGYVFEQYNPNDGSGQRGHPFTGWTSTVALMMAEIYS